MKRMQLEKIARISIDTAKVARCFPDLGMGIEAAVKDISIANQLSIGPYRQDYFSWQPKADGTLAKVSYPMIASLNQITTAK